MKPCSLLAKTAIFLLVTIYACTGKNGELYQARYNDFSYDWLFAMGDTLSGDSVHNIAATFNDQAWRKLDLPHDWSIEDLPGVNPENSTGPFTKNSPGGYSTGNTLGGTGWYRKHFNTEKNWQDKVVTVLFDGVQTLSDCWINGHYLGFHPNGYTSFYYDLTPYLKPAGEDNILVVRVKNPDRNTRWYCGSGIYRKVGLCLSGKTGIPLYGVSVTTPAVSREKSTVEVTVNLSNLSGVSDSVNLEMQILGWRGDTLAKEVKPLSLASGSNPIVIHDFNLERPTLWSPETPVLYTAQVKLTRKNKQLDEELVNFGIRSIEYSAAKGFLLNGEMIELKGGCMHHDNGLLGAAAYPDAEMRRVRLMKENGFNAIRTSHNPPSASFLDACDRLGMLVIDEAFDQWEKPKNPNDYHLYFRKWWQKDIESMIFRDRNHPSVVIWSIGNEIPERADTSGVRIGAELSGMFRMLDGTRPVTSAICAFWDAKGKTWAESKPAFACLDIGGYNYLYKEYTKDHQLFPERLMMGTESVPLEAWENWQEVEKNSYVIGDFVWTGMDYLGEAGIGHADYDTTNRFANPYPWFVSWCGDIDIIGNKKPQSLFRDVVWKRSPLEILVHEPVPAGKMEKVSYWGWPNELPQWTWPGAEGKKLHVNIYTSGDKVELFLNGTLVGQKEINEKDKCTAGFDLAYNPGELKAVAYQKGNRLAEKILATTGTPASLSMIAEELPAKPKRGDLFYIQVEVLDAAKNLVPGANLPLSLNLEGPADLMAGGNACPDCATGFGNMQFKSWRGKALIILRSTGKEGSVKLKLSSPGLQDGSNDLNFE